MGQHRRVAPLATVFGSMRTTRCTRRHRVVARGDVLQCCGRSCRHHRYGSQLHLPIQVPASRHPRSGAADRRSPRRRRKDRPLAPARRSSRWRWAPGCPWRTWLSRGYLREIAIHWLWEAVGPAVGDGRPTDGCTTVWLGVERPARAARAGLGRGLTRVVPPFVKKRWPAEVSDGEKIGFSSEFNFFDSLRATRTPALPRYSPPAPCPPSTPWRP